MATNNRVYKVVFFTQYGNVIAKNFKTSAEAEAYYETIHTHTPWCVVLNCLDADTVTAITPSGT